LPFSPVIRRSWEQVKVRDADWECVRPLSPYRFHLVQFRDYAGFILGKLREDRRVTVAAGFSAGTGSSAGTDVTPEHTARWVFDSSYPEELPRSAFYMHSLAWEVKTEKAAFDPEVVTFCDFPPAVPPGAFYYTLPLSTRQAVVYYVRWSMSREDRLDTARQALAQYLAAHPYTRLQEEHGTIPLFRPSSRKSGAPTLRIGASGGLVRACTGYGLTRIWRDSRNIVHSLEQHGHPFALPPDSGLVRLGDFCFRSLIRRYPVNARVVLRRLFERTSVGNALEFLEGTASFTPTARTMVAVTPGPFLVPHGKTVRYN
jgi:lycopene beta-cyclase